MQIGIVLNNWAKIEQEERRSVFLLSGRVFLWPMIHCKWNVTLAGRNGGQPAPLQPNWILQAHKQQSGSREQERETERQIIDAGVYRWRLRRFHKRVCRGLWGTIAPSTQMEGTVAKKRLPQDTQEYAHKHHTQAVCSLTHLSAEDSMLLAELATTKETNLTLKTFYHLYFFITSLYHLHKSFAMYFSQHYIFGFVLFWLLNMDWKLRVRN